MQFDRLVELRKVPVEVPFDGVIEPLTVEREEGNMKWISVDFNLPPDGSSVIMYSPTYGPIKNFMTINVFFRDALVSMGITHWMPLPQPPNASQSRHPERNEED